MAEKNMEKRDTLHFPTRNKAIVDSDCTNTLPLNFALIVIG